VSLATSTNSPGLATVVFAQTRQEFPVKPLWFSPLRRSPSRRSLGGPCGGRGTTAERLSTIGAGSVRRPHSCLLDEPSQAVVRHWLDRPRGRSQPVPQRNSIRAREPVVLRLVAVHGVGQPRPRRHRAGRVGCAPDDVSTTNPIVLFRRIYLEKYLKRRAG